MWSGLIWPRSTNKLGEPFSDYGGGGRSLNVQLGGEAVILDYLQHKESSDPITIDGIVPNILRDFGPTRLVDMALVVRSPGESFIAPSIYVTQSGSTWRDCAGQEIADIDGYVVKPGDLVFLAYLVRFEEEGSSKIRPAEVTFRRDGKRFRSHPGVHMVLKVKADLDRRVDEEEMWEWNCDHPFENFGAG